MEDKKYAVSKSEENWYSKNGKWEYDMMSESECLKTFETAEEAIEFAEKVTLDYDFDSRTHLSIGYVEVRIMEDDEITNDDALYQNVAIVEPNDVFDSWGNKIEDKKE